MQEFLYKGKEPESNIVIMLQCPRGVVAGSVVLQTMSLLYGYLAILFMDFLPMCVAMQITTMFKVTGNKYYFNDFLGMFFSFRAAL